MLTKREKKLSKIMIILQVALSVLVFLSIDYFFPSPETGYKEKLFFISQIVLIWTLLFNLFKMGIVFRAIPFLSMIRGYVVTIGLAGIILFVELRLMLLVGHHSYSAYYILWFCIANLVVLVVFKSVFYYYMRYLRKIGRNTRNVVFVADAAALPFIEAFKKAKDWGYKINDVIFPELNKGPEFENLVNDDNVTKLFNRIILKGVDDIFYCLPVNCKAYDIEQIVSTAEELGINVHIVREEFYGKFKNSNSKLNDFGNLFDSYESTANKYYSLKFKELFDIVFSVVVIVATLPIMLIIALLIKIEDGGDIFFRQERIGLNGRRFICYKFRSMIPNADELIDQLQHKNESDGPTFKIENDPRITWIGKFLRKTSLDEFPQFLNVIKGEMAVVGPRPPLLKEVKQYEKYQLRRLSMKPGISCIWQVYGRNKVSFKEWMQMDLEYIDNWSIWFDMKLIFKTIGVVFKANGQ